MNLKASGQLRRSQVITTYGPGALIDLPKHSAIVGGLDTWPATSGLDQIIEPRLTRKLQIMTGVPTPALFAPPPDSDTLGKTKTGIGAWRFPECGAAVVRRARAERERRARTITATRASQGARRPRPVRWPSGRRHPFRPGLSQRARGRSGLASFRARRRRLVEDRLAFGGTQRPRRWRPRARRRRRGPPVSIERCPRHPDAVTQRRRLTWRGDGRNGLHQSGSSSSSGDRGIPRSSAIFFWSVMIVSARCNFRCSRRFSDSSWATRGSTGRGVGPRRRPRISRRAPASRCRRSSSGATNTTPRDATGRPPRRASCTRRRP